MMMLHTLISLILPEKTRPESEQHATSSVEKTIPRAVGLILGSRMKPYLLLAIAMSTAISVSVAPCVRIDMLTA